MCVCMCVCMYVFTEEGAHKDKMTRTHNSHAVMILSHWTFWLYVVLAYTVLISRREKNHCSLVLGICLV